jgi:hypothetical protein
MVATDVGTERSVSAIEAPDFYWQFRLDRLVKRFESELKYDPSLFPTLSYPKDLYGAYRNELLSARKLTDFDWMADKDISDSEWMTIYKNICDWSETTVRANKPTMDNLPSNDFDLLQQFYPALNYRDLETPFIADEVGPGFPYKNMKELLSAAVSGEKMNLPAGYESVTALQADGVRKEISALKESTMAKLDAVYEEAMAYAKNPLPDDQSKTHYQALKAKLAEFPQDAAGWTKLRESMDKTVDEMARMASKEEDEHHHGEEEGKLSVAEEFQQKYGFNLDEMEERLNKYKADPEGFVENSILEKHGKNGLDVWKKSQEFSAKLAVMSEADKSAAEAAFADFLKKA